jgi:N-acetyl sugar amidotransferase
MKNATYRQCTRCVMDSSDPDISFDADGRCNHCLDYEARASSRARRGGERQRQQLLALVDEMKTAGRTRDYDCIAGISGGADSCYSLYVATTLGLRVLAVHMDNGWNSAIAVRNVKTVLEKLHLDYTSFVLDWDEFKDLQLAFLKASVPEIETPTDIAIPAALHRVAAEHGVRHIIAGGNIWTEGILPRSWHYDAKDVRYLKAIHRRFGTRQLSTFPLFGYRQEAYYKLVRGIHFVYLLEHVAFTSEEATAVLGELGWESPGGKHHESVITRFVQSYVLPTKFGIDYRRATFSTQICAGELTRDEALERLKNPPYDPRQVAVDKKYVAKKLGLGVDELDAILAAPPKSHRDYPNAEVFLQRLYAAYRRFLSPRRRADPSPS